MTVVLSDFNARVGKEGIFGITVGKFILHKETSVNWWLIDLSGARNLVFSTTRFQQRKTCQATWQSSYRTQNHTDHVVIDRSYVSSIRFCAAMNASQLSRPVAAITTDISKLYLPERPRKQTAGMIEIEVLGWRKNRRPTLQW